MPKYVNTAKNEFYDLTDPNAPKLLGNMSDYSKTLAEQNFQSYLDSIASQKIANEREWGGNKDTLTNSDWWKTFVSQERVGRLQQEQGNAYQSLLGQTEFREGLAPTAPAPESPYKAPTGFGRPPVQTASMPTGYNGVNTNPDFKAATTGKSAEVAIQMKDKQGNMINVYPSSIPDLIREGTLPNGTNGITLKEATLTSPTGVRKPVVVGGKEASSLFGQNWTLEKTPPTGGTITPESFTGVNKIDTSGAMGASGTSGADTVAAGMQASLDNYLALIKQKDTTDKKAYDDVLSKYISSLTTDVSKESLQATAETTAGISAKEQAVADAYSEVGIKLAEIEALDKSYQNSNLKAEGETVILSVMQGKMNQNFREYSIRKNLLTSEASLLQAKALGLQGKFDAAQKAADRSVDLKYADQLFKSNQQIKLLEVLKGQVDDENEKYRWALTQTLTDQRNALNQKMDMEKIKYAEEIKNLYATPKTSPIYTEWQDYVKTGGKLSFNDYMTMDANRKRSVNITNIVSPEQYNSDQQKLEASKGTDGYVNTEKYKELRNQAKDKTTFDKNFSYMLNPNDKSAVGFISNVKADVITPEQQSTINDAKAAIDQVKQRYGDWNNVRSQIIEQVKKEDGFDMSPYL